jgi:aryl-alcohol dehydrogenase-like predicted oxidoreductase
MKYTYLGRIGLKVSKICLGTANFGPGNAGLGEFASIGEKDAFRIMDFALDSGINFFDTANVYGGPGHRGLTEEIVGKWFSQGDNRREKVVIATKVGRVMEEENIDGPNKAVGLSLFKIRRHIEGSLRRLQTDHIELYQMHHVDRNVEWEELWMAFEGLINQGKVDYIGASNFAAWDLMKAQMEAKKRNFMGLVNEQHRYNLLWRAAELEVIPAAIDQGIGITVYSPLSRGLLGVNMFESLESFSDDMKIQLNRRKAQLIEYSKLCKKLGESEANISLAWLLSNPGVTSVIAAPGNMNQMEQLLRCVEIELDESTLEKIDEIFPGLGGMTGNAPQRYSGWDI